jgi:hypothetical protein
MSTLTWIATDRTMPDADTTVLMWVVYPDGSAEWASGWWDGIAWLDASTGGELAGAVTHWCEPDGPYVDC